MQLNRFKKRGFNSLLGATILLTITANNSHGQIRLEQLYKASPRYFEWGVQLGGNASLIKAYPFNTNVAPGGVIGAYIKKHNKDWGLQGGLQIATSQFTTTQAASYKFAGSTYFTNEGDTTTKGQLTNINVQVPIFAEIRTGPRFAVQIGAVYTYMVTSVDKDDKLKGYYKTNDLFKKSNFGGLFGIEYQLSKKLRLGASYTVNFLDINKGKFQELNDRWMTMNGQVMLSYQVKRWHGKKF